MAKRNELKNRIINILRQYPQARDSDQWLTLQIWCTYYPSRIHKDDKEKRYVYLRDVLEMPREDHVKRIRAIIQNVEHRFLPTTEEVRKKRQISEEEWNAYVTRGEKLF